MLIISAILAIKPLRRRRKMNCRKLIFALLFGYFGAHLQAQPVDNQSTANNTKAAQASTVLPNLMEFAATHKGELSAALIEPKDLMQRLSAGERLYILDARDEREYRISRIKGARRVGYADFSTEQIWMLRRNVPVIVYCTAGERSGILADYLLFSGFNNVSVLAGAIIGWSNAQQPLVDAKNLRTTQVHILSKENNSLLKKGKAVW